MAKGFAGTVFLDDRRLPGALRGAQGPRRRVHEEPEERPYGIDSAFRDPSGNNIRLTQVTMAGVMRAVRHAGPAPNGPGPASAMALPPRRDRLEVGRRDRDAAVAEAVSLPDEVEQVGLQQEPVVAGRVQSANSRAVGLPERLDEVLR